MAVWKRSGRRVNAAGTTVIYASAELPGVTVESRKRRIPHANRVGTWDHTSYFVVENGADVKERYTLKDAQAYAESLFREEISK